MSEQSDTNMSATTEFSRGLAMAKHGDCIKTPEKVAHSKSLLHFDGVEKHLIDNRNLEKTAVSCYLLSIS